MYASTVELSAEQLEEDIAIYHDTVCEVFVARPKLSEWRRDAAWVLLCLYNDRRVAVCSAKALFPAAVYKIDWVTDAIATRSYKDKVRMGRGFFSQSTLGTLINSAPRKPYKKHWDAIAGLLEHMGMAERFTRTELPGRYTVVPTRYVDDSCCGCVQQIRDEENGESQCVACCWCSIWCCVRLCITLIVMAIVLLLRQFAPQLFGGQTR